MSTPVIRTPSMGRRRLRFCRGNRMSVKPRRTHSATRRSACATGRTSPQRPTSPMTLTDIEVGTLREADRQILNTGLAVADREELLTLLEDLGS